MKPTSRLSFVLVLLAGHLLAVPAVALDPTRSITQYAHTKWTTTDGAPANIQAIAQSPDGYLWLGTASGLYRFDGITFERIPPIEGDNSRSDQIAALLAAPSGDIWVGYYWGGIALFHDGKLRDFNYGRPESRFAAFAQDAEGGVWAASDRMGRMDLSRYAHGRWQSFGADSGVPRERFRGVLATPDGAVWLVTQGSLLVLRRGTENFERVGGGPSLLAQDGFYLTKVGLATDSQGRAWISDCRGIRLLRAEPEPSDATTVPPAAGPCPRGASIPRTIIFDRDGSIWGTTYADGVARLRYPGSSTGPESGEPFRVADGLSSKRTAGLLEDREGDIWIGTSGGLDRFRVANVVNETLIQAPSKGGYIAMRDARGAIAISDGRSFYQVLPGAAPVAIPETFPGLAVTFCKENDGRVRVGSSTGGFFELAGGVFKKYATPVEPQPASFVGCAIDKYGTQWFTVSRHGLYRFDGKNLVEVNPFPDNLHLWSNLMSLDEQGRLLLYFGGLRSLVRADGDRLETLLTGHDSEIGFITVIAPSAHYVLLGSNTGLSQIDGNRIRTLPSSQYPWLRDIGSITQTSHGETWLFGIEGIIRLSTAELEHAFDKPGSPLRYELFDSDAGLPSYYDTENDNAPNNLEGSDGRIWFMANDRVVWIDPAHLSRNPLAPPVSIQRLVANDRHYSLPLSGALPKGVSRLEIDYTALSLSFPQRVRFLYKLDGVDDGWVDPGLRRQAFYTNLHPGHYHFTVIAANNDGVWNRTGASLDFSIAPAYWQMLWFKLACSAALAAVLWWFYRLRLRQVNRAFELTLDARVAERTRIARELHDTLLQGFHGVILRFQAAARLLPTRPAEGRQMLETTLDQAEQALADGRVAVQGLRSSVVEATDLADAIKSFGEELAADPARDRFIPLSLRVEGTPRKLRAIVRDEIYRIAGEALRNAFRHSAATHIEVEIQYDERHFELRVRDDGKGIDSKFLSQEGHGKHFGLSGMRERSEMIGGTLAVWTSPNSGTELELKVPGLRAYRASPRRGSWLVERLSTVVGEREP
jgi:signal transduction histidine kinase/ligand-binding sensor domain-containing protein